jgi:octaprenyl-diphosphate synthase
LGEKDVTFLDQMVPKTKSYVERIDNAVSRELDRYSNTRFYDPLVYALSGGKRIRSLIVLLSAETLGFTDDVLLDGAVAIELLHAESIIHDDIIDQENVRRGKVAFHIKYGYSASLLTADFVFSMILAIAARYQDRRVLSTLSNAALSMSEGEYAEVTIDPSVYKLTWEEYNEIIFNKTASLFHAAARLGAIIGRGSNEQVDSLSNYGKYVGMAYQIHDDLLDWGRQDRITTGLRNSADDQAVISQLKMLSQMYTGKAKQHLATLPNNPARSLLEELTDFSVQRKY